MQITIRKREPEDLRHWLAGMATLLLIISLAAGLQLAGVEICMFHRLTGWPCLTCGSTRAAAQLINGNLIGALRLQPLATLCMLAAAAAMAVYAAMLLVFKRVPRLHLTRIEWRLIICASAIAWVVNWCYLFGFSL